MTMSLLLPILLACNPTASPVADQPAAVPHNDVSVEEEPAPEPAERDGTFSYFEMDVGELGASGDTGLDADVYEGTLEIEAFISGTDYGDHCSGEIAVSVFEDGGVGGAATCAFSGLAVFVGVSQIELTLAGGVVKAGVLEGSAQTEFEGVVVEDTWSGTLRDGVISLQFSGTVPWSHDVFGPFALDYDGAVDAAL